MYFFKNKPKVLHLFEILQKKKKNKNRKQEHNMLAQENGSLKFFY